MHTGISGYSIGNFAVSFRATLTNKVVHQWDGK
jgi:hypothetical protein